MSNADGEKIDLPEYVDTVGKDSLNEVFSVDRVWKLGKCLETHPPTDCFLKGGTRSSSNTDFSIKYCDADEALGKLLSIGLSLYWSKCSS
jgi:hypothetical protein